MTSMHGSIRCLLLVAVVVLSQSTSLERQLLRSANKGLDRLDSVVSGAANALSNMGRRAEIASSDCSGNGDTACCPAQTQLTNIAGSTTECAPLLTIAPNASLPTLTDNQITQICSAVCYNSVTSATHSVDSLPLNDQTGCASVSSLRVYGDMLCLKDTRTNAYCYNTFRTLMTYNDQHPLDWVTLLNILCTQCGGQIYDYLFHLPPVVKLSLNIDSFFPIHRNILPLVCSIDVNDNPDESCLQDSRKQSALHNPCSFCGRVGIAVNDYLGLDIDTFALPIYSCVCADRTRTTTCADTFKAKNASYSGTGAFTLVGGGSNQARRELAAPAGINYDFRPCLDLMRGLTTTCSAECDTNIEAIMDDMDCCANCLLTGFNVTYCSATLPTRDVVYARLAACPHFDNGNADCKGRSPVSQNLTVTNLRYSWYTSSPTITAQVNDAVYTAVARAAACVKTDILPRRTFNLDGRGVMFEYGIVTSSDAQAQSADRLVKSVVGAHQFDFTELESVSFSDGAAAMYDTRFAYDATVVGTTSGALPSGLSVAAAMFVAVAALVSTMWSQ